MKISYKFAGPLAMLVVLSLGLLYSTRSVSAAAEGKITGTIKLDGMAPHQKPIDMSKEPSCAQQHAAHPITTETVVAGGNGGLANVVVYISEGLTGAAAEQMSSKPAQIDQKGCQYIPHVVALDVNQGMKVVNDDQNVPQHSPPTEEQSRVEQIATAGLSSLRCEVGS